MHFRTFGSTLLLLLLGAALAHAELEASSIEDGATLTQWPAEVSLTFSEAAELGFSTFKVYPLPPQVVAAQPAPTDGGDAEDHDAAETGDDHDGAAAPEADDHGDDGGHGALDAAAETLMAEVIELQDDAAARADTGVTPPSGQSETVALALKSDLAPGAYAVMWKVLSVNSHAIEGFLNFTYDSSE